MHAGKAETLALVSVLVLVVVIHWGGGYENEAPPLANLAAHSKRKKNLFSLDKIPV